MTGSGIVLAGLTAAVLAPTGASAAAPTPVTFVVNSTGDGPDAQLDGVCATSTGVCTLRAALTEADAAAARATIDFDIPGTGLHTIAPTSALPVVKNPSHPVTIDGFSQPGSAVNTDPVADNAHWTIELRSRLTDEGNGDTIRGLDIHGLHTGLLLGRRTVVVGDLLGLMPDGSLDPTVAASTVLNDYCVIVFRTNGDKIGQPGAANRNVISGCATDGIYIHGNLTFNPTVQNNIIGLDPTGTLRRGNRIDGIRVGNGVINGLIGGTGAGAANVISGNGSIGAELTNGSFIDNFIGTDPTGDSATAATTNPYGVLIRGGPTVSGNVIVNSSRDGVLLQYAGHSVVSDNRIGVTADGTVVGNGQNGITIAASADNVVGPGNVITGSVQGVRGTPLSVFPVDAPSEPSPGNTLTRNSIYGNTNPVAVDWIPYHRLNQGGDGNPQFNDGIDVPTLTAAPGQVTAKVCAGCTVELFESTAVANGRGSGITYLATATADSSGTATFTTPAGGWPALLTATATNSDGSTSEFAQAIPAPST